MTDRNASDALPKCRLCKAQFAQVPGSSLGEVLCYECRFACESAGVDRSALDRMAKEQRAPKFALGDRVRKVSGSEWQGRVVGTYTTARNPEGYCVESEAHAGNVQIYPAAALEKVED